MIISRKTVLAPAVHVWTARVAPGGDAGREILSTDERARGERLVDARARVQFLQGRMFLRRVLARYLPLSPAELSFRYGPAGKPYLAADGGDLSFSLSHAGDIIIIAVTAGKEVGIDVEEVRADLRARELAERFFSRREAESLSALPPECYGEAFFRCWTRKEAYAKARGSGFTRPCNRFSVTASPDAAPLLLADDDFPDDCPNWHLVDLKVPTGYVAALAINGFFPRIAYQKESVTR